MKQEVEVAQTPEWEFRAKIVRNITFKGRYRLNFCPNWVKNGKKLISFKNFTLGSPKVTKLISK